MTISQDLCDRVIVQIDRKVDIVLDSLLEGYFNPFPPRFSGGLVHAWVGQDVFFKQRMPLYRERTARTASGDFVTSPDSSI